MKYKLRMDLSLQVGSSTLHRIEALRTFKRVSCGDLGGYVESEANLSQEGDCWVYWNAQVYGNAKVYGNASISGDAKVYGNAQVHEDAWVFGDAWVYGSAQVYENAWVYGNVQISRSAQVYGSAQIYGSARVTECLYVRQFKHSITATDTHVFIGCEGHTWEYWTAHVEEIGRRHRYATEEIDEVKSILNILKVQITRQTKEIFHEVYI